MSHSNKENPESGHGSFPRSNNEIEGPRRRRLIVGTNLQSPGKTSSLLDLPYEIRLMIIGYVFRGSVVDDSHEYRSELYNAYPHDAIDVYQRCTRIRHFERSQADKALLDSCQKLRQEGLQSLYQQNTIVVPHGHVRSLRKWLDDLSEEGERHIRTMQIRLGFEDINQKILQKALDEGFGKPQFFAATWRALELDTRLYRLWRYKIIIILARKMSGRFPRLQTLEILAGANCEGRNHGLYQILSIDMSKADELDDHAYQSKDRVYLEWNDGNSEEDDQTDVAREARYECMARNLYRDLTREDEDTTDDQLLDAPWASLRDLLKELSDYLADKVFNSDPPEYIVQLELDTECRCHRLARLLGGVEQWHHYALRVGTCRVDTCCRKSLDWV